MFPSWPIRRIPHQHYIPLENKIDWKALFFISLLRSGCGIIALAARSEYACLLWSRSGVYAPRDVW